MFDVDNKKRFLDAITLKECGSLSHGDVMIHDKLVAEITNVSLEGDDGNALARIMNERMSDENYKRHKKARRFLGLDWVHVFPREAEMDCETLSDGSIRFKDVWGTVQIVNEECSHIAETPIRDCSTINNYRFPEVDAFDFYNVQIWIDDGEFAVVPQLDTGFFKASQLTGFENYMFYINENKNEMHGLMEKFLAFEIEMADRLIDMGVDVIWLGNDFCYNAGPFISPELLQEFDFDYTKKLVDHVRGRGLPVILHCCGNIKTVIRQMIDTGVNAIHSVQPTAGNDIYAYKKEYGNDVCLIGNIDINELMPKGSPCDVDDKVREMVENLFYDRKGWVLSTTNLLSTDTPVKNAIAMHLAAEKYGR